MCAVALDKPLYLCGHGRIVGRMGRVRVVAAVIFPVAIGLGLVGAWAFNPDSGAVSHDALLWHIFGGMFEIGMLVGIVGVLLAGVLTACFKMLGAGLRQR